MIILHHLEDSRSQRILWLLEELQLDYEIKYYPRTEAGLAPKALKEVHSLGKSPVITDGDLTLAESGAIIYYIIKKYGKGRLVPSPTNPQSELDDIYFQHFAEGSMMNPLVTKLVFAKMYEKSPFYIKPVTALLTGQVIKGFLDPTVVNGLGLIDGYLKKDGGRDWLAGGIEPTGADFMMSFPLEAIVKGGRMALEQVPDSIKTYVARYQARPAYQRGLAKGPGYKYGELQRYHGFARGQKLIEDYDLASKGRRRSFDRAYSMRLILVWAIF